jgi:hypothetical protein
MTAKDRDAGEIEAGFGDRLDAPAPPPAPALLDAVSGMSAVRTRGRFGAFAAVLGIALVAPLVLLAVRPMRRDLGALPPVWLVAAAAVWLGAFVVSLAAALVPMRGDVLPAAGRASRVGVGAIAGLAAFVLVASVDAPGVSAPAPHGMGPLLASCLGCMGVLLPIAGLCLIAGVVVLRRALPMGARRIGVALGAAGGAMGGAALVFHCPIAGKAHLVLGHVGGVALAALAGALLLPLLLDRPSR